MAVIRSLTRKLYPFCIFTSVACAPAPRSAAPAEAPQAMPQADGSDAPQPSPPALVATPPDFELNSLSGESVRLSEHFGSKVILLDFWATYCDPCISAMPHLQELYVAHQSEGFLILGISIDGPESVAQVRTEVRKLGLSFPILLDTESEVAALYNPKSSAPYSVLIGRDGGVIRKFEGYTPGNSAQLEQDLAQALAR